MARQVPEAQITVTAEVTASLGRRARQLLQRVLPSELIDDRFDAWTDPTATSESPDTDTDTDTGDAGSDPSFSPGPGFVAVLAHRGPELVAYLGGGVSRGRLQLDALVDPAEADPPLLVGQLLDAVATDAVRSGAERLEVWGRPAQPWHQEVAASRGLTASRGLHQMRCPLPAPGPVLPTRGFEPGDLEAVLAVNNRAFAAHPDQGHQSVDDWRSATAEPWFQPEGLRVYERDDRVAGFCWTKIHPGAQPPLGEIYVIGVDPDFHGQGLGAPMTAAGLQWLHDQGLQTGMLYVEADNEPAIRTYHRLGFETVRTDRAWAGPIPASPQP